MEEITSFSFTTSSQIIFKSKAIFDLKIHIPKFGSKVFLVTNKTFSVNNPVEKILDENNIRYTNFVVHGEPTEELVSSGVNQYKQSSAEMVVAIGGGSVLDTGKAIAMLAANGGTVMDYIEVVGKGIPITKPSVPLIAIPTTSGTGSEVTRNAVISIPELKTKASIRNDLMFPKLALIDPELTLSLPEGISAYTGLDALTQVIEPYFSLKANRFIDALCLDAIHIGYDALPVVYSDPNHLEARTAMSYTSLIGGIALTNAGLGAVHGFAAALGGMYGIPHGIICGRLLAPVLEANWAIVEQDEQKVQLKEKFHILSGILNCHGKEAVDEMIYKLYKLRNDLGIPSLGKFGINKADIEEIVKKTAASSSYKGNPVLLPNVILMDIVEKNI